MNKPVRTMAIGINPLLFSAISGAAEVNIRKLSLIAPNDKNANRIARAL